MSDGPPETLTLRIEKPVVGGRMLARDGGAVVLVSGALPGELVVARVERSGQGTRFARVERVLEPSADRVGEPNPCGGCVLAHAGYERQLAIKQQIVQDGFARLARQTIGSPTIFPSPSDGYRMRARLHVQDRRIGFFLEGTHTLCDAGPTHQLRPDTLAALDALIPSLGTTIDDVIAIELAENREATERVVHLEVRADADTARLGSVTVSGITGMSFSHARSPRIHVVSGEGRVTDHFIRGEREWAVSRSAPAFFQGNRYLLNTLVNHVVDRLGNGGGVTDLYAGAGLFSIAAAAHGLAPVIAVEGDPLSAADLRRNSTPWGGVIQARHAPVEDYLRDRRLVRSPTVLLDPPRTGLSRRALQSVIALHSPRIVYVSCDVATLARDTRALVEAGYGMGEVALFDLFPNTAHVESVAVFETGSQLN